MDKFLQKKYVVPAIIVLIMAGAFAVRFYHFNDWLYFKMDQSRDSFMIANAVQNGPLNLPLLGARAGATKVKYGFLRLGPIFYYFQYLSGVIFHSIKPQVFAYPDLFFSIAAIPLLYVFLRLYFKRLISLLIVLMYSFSFLIIEYSRFAWNPNSLPFFTILSFLGLLKFLNSENEKNRKWWIVLWATGLAIGSQLHFLGFFSLVGISALLFFFHYKLWKKEIIGDVFQKESLKKIAFYSAFVLAVFIIFYTPVIISDVMRHGENTKDLFQAFSSKPSNNPLTDKFMKNVHEHIEYYSLITTSYIFPSKVTSKDYWPIIFTGAIFLLGFWLAIQSIRKISDNMKKDFLILLLLWVGFFFILTTPVAYQTRPRYFIFTFAVPFIFLGLIFEFLENKFSRYSKVAIFILTAAILFFNANGTMAWFKEQAKSQSKYFTVKRTLILKAKDGVTLGELQGVVDYIYANRKNNNNIYFYVKPEHVRPIQYLLYEKNDPTLRYFSLSINGDPKAQYFAVVPASKDGIGAVTKKYGVPFNIVSQKQFGQLMVYEINFPNRTIIPDFQIKTTKSKIDRVFWRDVFGIKSDSKSSAQLEKGD